MEVQVTELRRTYQSLEIELQSHLSMVSTSDPQRSVWSVLARDHFRTPRVQTPVINNLSPCRANQETGPTADNYYSTERSRGKGNKPHRAEERVDLEDSTKEITFVLDLKSKMRFKLEERSRDITGRANPSGHIKLR